MIKEMMMDLKTWFVDVFTFIINLPAFIKKEKVPLSIAAGVAIVWGVLLLVFGDVNFGEKGLILIPLVLTLIIIRSFIGIFKNKDQ